MVGVVVGLVVGVELEVVVAVVVVMVVVVGSQRRRCRSHYDSSGSKVHSWAMVCHCVVTWRAIPPVTRLLSRYNALPFLH